MIDLDRVVLNPRYLGSYYTYPQFTFQEHEDALPYQLEFDALEGDT